MATQRILGKLIWSLEMAKKTITKAEKEERVLVVAEMLLTGYRKEEVIVACTNKWKVAKSTVQKYIKLSFVKFKEAQNPATDELLAFHIEARLRLLKQSIKNKENTQIALQILMDVAKIQGIYGEAEKKSKGTHTVEEYREIMESITQGLVTFSRN